MPRVKKSEVRRMKERLAEIADDYRSRPEAYNNREIGYLVELAPITISAWIRKGKILFHDFPIRQALDDLEIEHFRRCGLRTCGRIFYQTRARQSACSPKHSRALATQKYLDKEGSREEANRKKRENRKLVREGKAKHRRRQK